MEVLGQWTDLKVDIFGNRALKCSTPFSANRARAANMHAPQLRSASLQRDALACYDVLWHRRLR